jgi:hypothetical protein
VRHMESIRGVRLSHVDPPCCNSIPDSEKRELV